uniref:RING-type domain-containing protein n=1 Tax=Wuchereria bancrofti TaxID=6293 RepID=A0AAF5PI03_WUCBA
MEEGNAVFCSICLGLGSWPKARPKICEHIFCYICISTWVKVCFIDYSYYELSLVDEELFQETEDITVVYARCQVCNLSKNEHLLLLCDGIIGQNVDGSVVRCNAACHCYCLPEKFDSVPDGDWFCTFCADIRATQESVYNSRYAREKHPSSSDYHDFVDFKEYGILNEDEPGPSGINQSFQLRRYGSGFHSDKCLTKSGSNSVKNSASDDGDDADWDNQDDKVLVTDLDIDYDPTGATEVTRWKWHKHRRAKKTKKARKRRSIRKKNVKHRNAKVLGKSAERKSRQRKKKGITGAQKRLTGAVGLDPRTGRQKKREKSKRHFPSKCICRRFNTPILLIRNGDDLGIPVETSLLSTEHINDKLSSKKPVEETDLITSIMFEQAKTLASARYQCILRDGTIGETEQMIKQRKKLLNEKIVACKELVSSEDLKDSDENISMYSASSSHVEAKEKRKRRPSRWGTPTTSKSHDNTIITASIPLPLGPPLTQSAVSLENIPVPSIDQQPPQSQALSSKPSAVNTAPSTSFALKSASIPFGMASGQSRISLAPFAGSALGQQPLGLSQQSLVTLGQQQLTGLGQQTLAGLGQQSVPGLSQPQLTSIGQGSLVQMQPSLLPNFFLPSLNLSAMNGLLAAGLLANNNPLAAPPITQPLAPATTTPFILNPVQFSAASAQQLNQHFVNLATTLRRNVDTSVDSAHLSQQSSKQPEGVPPPPPVIKPSESISNDISLCEPLAEKIRKLIEASNVKPLCDLSVEDGTAKIGVTVDDQINNVVLCDNSKMGESGRKSASADDEETGEAAKVKKLPKNGAMFEEARRMLSSSLKRVYRLKQITKQEYKEIMKKGVTALSQRTKLDQRKVDEYAAKYVECVVHRRKKRH